MENEKGRERKKNCDRGVCIVCERTADAVMMMMTMMMMMMMMMMSEASNKAPLHPSQRWSEQTQNAPVKLQAVSTANGRNVHLYCIVKHFPLILVISLSQDKRGSFMTDTYDVLTRFPSVSPWLVKDKECT